MNYELAQELKDAGFPNIKDLQHRQGREFILPKEVFQSIHLATPRISRTGLSQSWKNSLRHVGKSLTD
jgi:hypothetical protein